MGRSGGMFHEKLPPDSIVTVRAKDTPIEAANVEQFTPAQLALELLRYREALGEIARQAENRSFPVDEYNTCPITGAATESTLVVMPTYEYKNEKIESIIVGGPASAAVTIILGDRSIPAIIPVSGILVIAPVAIILGRNDNRQLTSATPGIFFFELMGIADQRYNI